MLSLKNSQKKHGKNEKKIKIKKNDFLKQLFVTSLWSLETVLLAQQPSIVVFFSRDLSSDQV